MMLTEFSISKCEKCLCRIPQVAMWYIIVCLYVDDVLIIGSNNDIIN